MQFAVIQLRDAGRRLTRDEIAAAVPTIGHLEVNDWREGNASRRILREARLIEQRLDFKMPVLPTLFDPVLLRATSRWMVLRGWQIITEAGPASREVVQEWLAREVTPEIEAAVQRHKAAARKQASREGARLRSEGVGVVDGFPVIEQRIELRQ